MEPEIRYARNGDVAIAYQVVGSGRSRPRPRARATCRTSSTSGESPYWRDFYERLARSFRLILFDKRGTGLSDRGDALSCPGDPDGGHANRARRGRVRPCGRVRLARGRRDGGALRGHVSRADGRARALPVPCLRRTNWPVRRISTGCRRGWGTQQYSDELLTVVCPTLLRSEADRLWFANSHRVGASPEVAYELNKAFTESDLRPVLPAIRVPTLVFIREGWRRMRCARRRV